MEDLVRTKLFNGIYHNRKVMITGITGFKGSWLAFLLKKHGANITGYSLAPPTKPSHFELLNLDIDMYYNDILDFNKLEKTVCDIKPEIVFHLAAQSLVRYSYKNPRETFETNVIGSLNLFEACRNCESVKAIINVTSDKCYDNKEWLWPYRETDPMGGFDPYSASKGCSELLTSCYRNSFFNSQNYGKDHNILIASCRAGNVIGGGDWAEDRLLPDLIRAASNNEITHIRNPHASRPWQHVLEPLSGYLLVGQKLLQKETDFADAWNFGPWECDNKKVINIVKIMKKYWDKVDFIIDQNTDEPHEAHNLRLDSTKSVVKLGWKPVWDTEQAVQMTTEWYKAYYDEKYVLTEQHLQKYIHDSNKNHVSWIN